MMYECIVLDAFFRFTHTLATIMCWEQKSMRFGGEMWMISVFECTSETLHGCSSKRTLDVKLTMQSDCFKDGFILKQLLTCIVFHVFLFLDGQLQYTLVCYQRFAINPIKCKRNQISLEAYYHLNRKGNQCLTTLHTKNYVALKQAISKNARNYEQSNKIAIVTFT